MVDSKFVRLAIQAGLDTAERLMGDSAKAEGFKDGLRTALEIIDELETKI